MSRPALLRFASRRLQPVAAAMLGLAALQLAHAAAGDARTASPRPEGARGQIAWDRS